jgi:uncharacterized membrane protein
MVPVMSVAHKHSARTQLLVSGGIGVAAGVVVTVAGSLKFGALIGWDVAALVYLVWVWLEIARLDERDTARLAEHEDPTRATADFLVLSAATASLLAVAAILAQVGTLDTTAALVAFVLGLASVVLSWAVVHTIYTLRYARMYYYGEDGGVNFNEDEPPCYSDFAYLSFTIGMTFQVSDTDLLTKDFRRVALRHALLSFVFATGILATTVNLVASLSSK